jgi:hypothetical protein
MDGTSHLCISSDFRKRTVRDITSQAVQHGIIGTYEHVELCLQHDSSHLNIQDNILFYNVR